MSVHVVRATRLAFVVLLVGIGSLLSTGTASAGGPTSALLVSPGEEYATGLYHSDPEYGLLGELLGEPPTGGTATEAGTGAAETAANYVTITWLIHDVTVWRIDRVFLPAEGEPLIVTQEVLDSAGNAATARHHRSPDPAALISLLQKLGLIESGSSSPVAEFVPAAADSAGTPGQQTIVEPSSAATAVGWWLLGGLGVGIAACALTIRYVPAVRDRVLARAPAFESERDQPGDEPVRMSKLPVS
jgi:hypothetical protein